MPVNFRSTSHGAGVMKSDLFSKRRNAEATRPRSDILGGLMDSVAGQEAPRMGVRVTNLPSIDVEAVLKRYTDDAAKGVSIDEREPTIPGDEAPEGEADDASSDEQQPVENDDSLESDDNKPLEEMDPEEEQTSGRLVKALLKTATDPSDTATREFMQTLWGKTRKPGSVLQTEP